MAKKNYTELLQQRRYDPNKQPPKEQVVFLIDSKNIGTLQNFVTITGMQKSGKTTFMSAMLAAAITGEEKIRIRIKLPAEKYKVSYWDTEQGDYDFYKTIDRVKSFCNTDELPAHFDSYNVREDDPADILPLIDEYLKNSPRCGLLVIDGILDLINSFNDEAESKRLVNFLKKITKKGDLLCICTLHKGKTTSNTLGHLGSMADRAAQSVLQVEKNKDKGTFILKADYLRSADDIDPIEIHFNKNNNTWEETFYNPEQDAKVKPLQLRPQDFSRDQHTMCLIRVFSLQEFYSYKDLVQNIKEEYGYGDNWAKDCIKYLKTEGMLFKTIEGYTNRQQQKLFNTEAKLFIQ